MMAKKMAEALGMELEIVRSDWDSLVPAVMSGTVDCVIAGQSITSKRMESVDFTTPYYYASVVTLVKARRPLCRCRRRGGPCRRHMHQPAQYHLV